MKEMLLAIWRYRHFILSSIRNDLRSRFARSKLGALWMILQPLAQVAIYSLVLSRIMSAKLPGIDSRYAYSLYLLSGMLAWSLFSEIVSRSLTVFVDNASMLKKIVFPRVCLPLIVVGSALVNNLLLLVVTVIVFALLGEFPGTAAFWIPALMVCGVAFALGLGLLLGVLNVFVRDINQFMQVILQLWFWLTPIVYMTTIIPPALMSWMRLNPMYWIVTEYQGVLVYGRGPEFMSLLPILVSSLVLLVVGLLLFRKAAPDMVDVL
ncbi:ABC transporter permease [Pinirhizobacter soli]|uniref:ABC transporter permease n=1 Tax=Pinirhizobacter soli TaxID=2786953 RepID=UPI00202A5AC9|nr:ABC transporter permease [Pinirhizobacter soli]